MVQARAGPLGEFLLHPCLCYEDHIGALSYLLAEVNVPVYGTALAVALASSRIEEAGIEASS